MIDFKEFMQENNIVILAEADVKEDMFHIHKINKDIQSYDLFMHLIMYSDVETLVYGISGQIMPRMWGQGETKCVICKPCEDKIVCAFYDTQLDAGENYYYAQKLNDELSKLFTVKE